jgi:3-methyladenine DNA glycosylase AlkC
MIGRMNAKARVGASRPADVPEAVLRELESGRTQTRTLAESLAVDFATLLAVVHPDLAQPARATIDPSAGITRRMTAAAGILHDHLDPREVQALSTHPSDTVRGWAAYAIGLTPDLPVAERLDRIRGFADDPHFGVREWAWLAIRRHLAVDIGRSIELLVPWAREKSDRLRRFASESTRPRGVWCAHIPVLKNEPHRGLPILEVLRADPSRYVQDSVANWLNDAAKTAPEWVRTTCDRWLEASDTAETRRISTRATRSL